MAPIVKESAETVFIIIPGLGNSGKKHWQTIWEKNNPNFIRVQQQNWEKPNCADWVRTLEHEVARHTDKQVYLIAHSLGSITVVHWAQQTKLNVAGALLVAPPDVDGTKIQELTTGFAPVPLKKLPFESIVIASSDDEYANILKPWQYAQYWDSKFVNVGKQGHINEKSGHGEWPEGLKYLQILAKSQVNSKLVKQIP